MKIGYLKFTMNMELDFTAGKIGNIEGRATLFKAIVDAGWDLTLYSQISAHDEQVYFERKYSNEYGIDNRWISKIDYRAGGKVKPNTDLLIVENGPDNWLFRTRYGINYGNQPFVRRCAEVLNTYQGLVFILNIHPDVPFPLDKMAYCDVPYGSNRNVYRSGNGSDVKHGWASWDEVCKDKKLVFFNQAYNQEAYLDAFDKKRQGYRKHKVKFYRLPILYGDWLIPENIRGWFRKKPHFELVYMGYPRYREKEFRQFFFDISEAKIDSWGPWNKKANLKFKEEATNNGIKVHDFLPAQVQCTLKYQNSKVTLGLISKKLQACGWVTHRTLESIHSGCILLGLRNAEGISDYLDDDFLVGDKEEFVSKIKQVLNWSYIQRKHAHEEQFKKIKKYDGEFMLKYLTKMYRREKT